MVQTRDKEEWEREWKEGREGGLTAGVSGLKKMWKAIRGSESDAKIENDKMLQCFNNLLN